MARRTHGCSGAELAGIMRQAASYAMERWLSQESRNRMVGSTISTTIMTSTSSEESSNTRQNMLQRYRSLQYVWSDFEQALIHQ